MHTVEADAIRITNREGESLIRLHTALNRYCLSLTGSRWDAEDLAQDTWLKAIGTLQQNGHANPEAFLLRIARNSWIDTTRKKNVAERLKRLDRQQTSALDDSLLELEFAFQTLVDQLSPIQRAVILLRDVFGYSAAEAADLMGTTEGAVKAALHRARQSLQAFRDRDDRGEAAAPLKDGTMKAALRAMAHAYRAGDIAALLELVQRDEVEAALAIQLVQANPPRKATPVKISGHRQAHAIAA